MALSDHLTGMVLFNSNTQKGYYIESAGSVQEIVAKWDGATVSSGTITSMTGTLQTAAQPNITSLGTLTSLTVDNITVNGATISSSTGTITSSDNLTLAASQDFNVLDGSNYTIDSLSEVVLKATATHATYASELLQLVTIRAASSAYNAIIVRANAGADPTFKARGNGEITADGSFTGGGADFAEFMEWEDGNPNNEDRTGMTVVIGKQKTTGNITPMIRLYEGPTDIIVGVVSASPTVLGGSDWNNWQGKFLKNKYGAYLYDEKDERIVNPEWDGTSYEDHIPREERKEWAKIGICGFVVLNDGQETDPRWLNFGPCGDNVSRWLIR